MSVMFSRVLKTVALFLLISNLGACGFHLRENASLPMYLRRIHVIVNGNNDFQRTLVRALRNSQATIEADSGPGIVELRVPVVSFTTDVLSVGGSAQVTEYAVHLNVQFALNRADGTPLLSLQQLQMSREYSYDASNPIGNTSQVEQIQDSLIDDAVQAILFRLQAVNTHP
jgi:LPS-assembly lipoprotein